VADYPFTTLIPHLGVVSYDEGKSFVVADIPGLIEGAHKGAGLGTRFLRHIERTRLLLHLIDVSDPDPKDPWDIFEGVREELLKFNPSLIEKPQIVVLNKIDLPEVRGRIEEVRELFEGRGLPFLPISASTGEGVRSLVMKTAEILESLKDGGEGATQ